ncbi:aromatic aminotransferase [Colletotrichum karsti]|uniref:Aromatic aminotransferase n=1 Tax=Colletotrichum karsti TaxID=1095194 RepID=A0A9P6LIR7_9PEZI|nr:aromatic aminotransferase [Colletotrichum karsti]KAF9873902.1 aromatic aminotransferase [Colletotrichum karsti]
MLSSAPRHFHHDAGHIKQDAKMTAFLDLPNELLMQIISLLCPHCVVVSQNLGGCTCNDDRPKGASRLSESDLHRQALSRLSRTCHTLRNIAQPMLYHSPKPIIGSELFLARTLASNRELAQAVKELHLGKWSVNEKDVTPELQDLFNGIIDRVGIPAQLLSDLDNDWPRDWLTGPDGGKRDPYVGYIPDATKPGGGKNFFDRRVRVVDALIVTLVPNVEHIHVEPLFAPHFPFSAPGSLPRLTDLTLQTTQASEGNSIDCVKGIMDAAPALERFRGVGVNGMTTSVTHPALKSLDLSQSILGATHINAIMTGFPKLEVFGYEVDHNVTVAGPNDIDANPQEIGEALLLRKDTLKDVDLDLARSSMYRIDQDTIASHSTMRSLKEMEVLEELAIGYDAILVPRTWDDGEEEGHEDGDVEEGTTDGALHRGRKKDSLVDFLPVTLRYLKLCDEESHLFQDLIELAGQVPEKFPNLKKVRFWGYDEYERMALRGSFRKVGVKCFHGGYL